MESSLSNAQGFIPGGASDDGISTTKTNSGTDTMMFKGETFYSEAGQAAWDTTTGRRVAVASFDATNTGAVFVNSVNGNLMARVGNIDANHDNFAYNLAVIYSEDQGAV